MITRRAALGGLLAAATLPPRAGAAAETSKEVRIGYQKSGILALVRQKGSIEARLKSVGVDTVRWVEFQYGPPIMEALGLGSIDLGAAGDTPPIFSQVAGAKIVYVAATPAQASAILVPPDSPIWALADLKGRKVAFARGSSSHNFVVQALAKAGLTPSDITSVYLAPADATAAFSRGSFEAWAVWDPYVALAEQRDRARVLTMTDGILDSNSFYLANRDFAGAHSAIVKAALDGIGEVTTWAATHRGELARAISEATGIDLAAQQRTVERLKIEITPMTDRIVQSQQGIADRFHRLGLVPRQVSVRDAVWTRPQA